ncbi:hypothetical protein [Rouxiella sp. WC2420]|uniref:Uncharacterized protein n=1 Tax=Rouxiella sp. WC2420 TaxID=3234145 RepID=A0AB39VLU3_9GAMM
MRVFRVLSLYTAEIFKFGDGNSSVINQAVFNFEQFPAPINFLVGAYILVPKSDPYFNLRFDVFDDKGKPIHDEIQSLTPFNLTEYNSTENETVLHIVFQPKEHILVSEGTYRVNATLLKDEAVQDEMDSYFIASTAWHKMR